MIIARPYQNGEAASLKVAEPDPHYDWLTEMETQMRGLVSYEIDGELIAVSGYELLWQGVAWAFALVDRAKCKGHGRELATRVRESIDMLVVRDTLHRVQATCDPSDPATKVFLRAIGFRLESRMRRAAPNGNDVFMMAMIPGGDL